MKNIIILTNISFLVAIFCLLVMINNKEPLQCNYFVHDTKIDEPLGAVEPTVDIQSLPADVIPVIGF